LRQRYGVILRRNPMAKSKQDKRNTPPAEDTQKLYARAYGARLAKQVAKEGEGLRRKATRPKRDGKA
jgi:hypothetical protein